MKIIAHHAEDKKLVNDALAIGANAKEAKKVNPSVIDATLGTFINEDLSFSGYKTVRKILNSFNDEQLFSYSPSSGGRDFEEAVLNWVFKSYRNDLNSLNPKVIPTPGGTGALSSSIFNSMDKGQTLLIPELSWGPYVGIAKNYELNIKKYNFFNNNGFNLDGFIKESSLIIEKEKRLVTIINDPCNNPTGYSLTKAEVEGLIDFCNSQSVPIVLIYDIAYLDYSFEDENIVRSKFKQFLDLNDNVMVIIAFSASKTFSVYGQRLGAQIFLNKNENNVNDYFHACNYFARNTWSNCNKAMINMMIKFDKDEYLRNEFKEELKNVVSILQDRAKIFLAEAKCIGLKVNPYSGGFFITIPVKDVDCILDELRDNESIFLLPFASSIRVALCAVPIFEIKGLASRIKGIIDNN